MTAREFIKSLETSVDLEKALFYLGQYTGKGNHYVSFPDANIPDDVDPVEFAEYLAEQD